MTKQEIYTKVRNHLLSQGTKSMLSRSSNDFQAQCAYRGEEGRSCAAGCLIPDENYSPALESFSATSPRVAAAMGFPGDNAELSLEQEEQLHMIRQLQIIHDTFDPCNWRERLDMVAKRYGFSTEP